MRQIVVATFDQQDSARAAIAALANDRFDPRRVHAIACRGVVCRLGLVAHLGASVCK